MTCYKHDTYQDPCPKCTAPKLSEVFANPALVGTERKADMPDRCYTHRNPLPCPECSAVKCNCIMCAREVWECRDCGATITGGEWCPICVATATMGVAGEPREPAAKPSWMCLNCRSHDDYIGGDWCGSCADPVYQLTPDTKKAAKLEQVGGEHYIKYAIQPFDIIDCYGLNYYEGNALKYLLRHRDKNGVEDLKKARHYIEVLIAKAEEDFGD